MWKSKGRNTDSFHQGVLWAGLCEGEVWGGRGGNSLEDMFVQQSGPARRGAEEEIC